MGSLDHRVALVTGGGSGIGKAIAAELGREGAAVVVTDINAETARESAEAIEAAGGRAASMAHDAESLDQHIAAVEFAVETFGALHLAVNNAGIGEDGKPLAEKDMASWDKVIALNLSGVAYGCHAQLKQFLSQRDGVPCAIVNMGSIHSSVALKGGIPAYTAAKHGVVGLTKAIAADYADRGIRCNAVGPAYIDTPLLTDLRPETRELLVRLHPQGRLGEAEEVAKLAAFLLSDAASFINGSYHLVDGGYTAI
ncbi:SDR family NAD(P)-dependent oxidoreductase [Corynebacterium liangguodongii]|uniref:Short-chain dehydrogenase n=1 Tax=Corynebacterium liangguodongii TaxID=2079535 RepID=A0A2S0WBN0_9CORY|nr:glucose 1-dehydrogenase [Corynebacterium liangguodongii]AWB83176.1 short-chain dehydrogenase [Corynebacterium liangguodongii]PWB98771.1 3-oxoacyl-ACP reductase [Corynebacterium liangguodongii]